MCTRRLSSELGGGAQSRGAVHTPAEWCGLVFLLLLLGGAGVVYWKQDRASRLPRNGPEAPADDPSSGAIDVHPKVAAGSPIDTPARVFPDESPHPCAEITGHRASKSCDGLRESIERALADWERLGRRRFFDFGEGLGKSLQICQAEDGEAVVELMLDARVQGWDELQRLLCALVAKDGRFGKAVLKSLLSETAEARRQSCWYALCDAHSLDPILADSASRATVLEALVQERPCRVKTGVAGWLGVSHFASTPEVSAVMWTVYKEDPDLGLGIAIAMNATSECRSRLSQEVASSVDLRRAWISLTSLNKAQDLNAGVFCDPDLFLPMEPRVRVALGRLSDLRPSLEQGREDPEWQFASEAMKTFSFARPEEASALLVGVARDRAYDPFVRRQAALLAVSRGEWLPDILLSPEESTTLRLAAMPRLSPETEVTLSALIERADTPHELRLAAIELLDNRRREYTLSEQALNSLERLANDPKQNDAARALAVDTLSNQEAKDQLSRLSHLLSERGTPDLVLESLRNALAVTDR